MTAAVFAGEKYDSAGARFYALCAAMGIYAAFGAPTPDDPATIEIIVGALLLTAAGGGALRNLAIIRAGKPLWRAAGQALFLFVILIALPLGILNGAEPRLMLRDLIPLLFMLMPLLMTDIFQERPRHAFSLLAVYAAAGLCFALRALMESGILPGGFLRGSNLDYFANAPSVLFAALWIGGTAAAALTKSPRLKNLAFLFAAGILCAAPFMAMAAAQQRAGIGAVFLYAVLLCCAGLWRYPYRVVFLCVLALGCAIAFAPMGNNIEDALARKTALHGFNMRAEEAAAAERAVSGAGFSFLFGKGLGAGLESPAVAGIRVNYTHSLLTSMLLKTGIAGLALTLAYLSAIGRLLWKTARADFPLGLALAAPFLIDVFLYAAYKSLDFGLLLLIITVRAATARSGPVEFRPPLS